MSGQWQQLRTPNLSITYTGGMCLEAIRTAFGIPSKYGRAIDDWNSGSQHTDAIPAGVYVPIYFSLANVPAGHIAIQLPDGRVASSTHGGVNKGLYIHPNRADLIRIYSDPKYGNGACTYLGWSEEVNDVAVVKLIPTGDDMTIIVKPIDQLNVTLAHPIMMFDFEHNKALWNSGNDMQVTQKTNIINGDTYYVPRDRAENGELFGFKEKDVFAPGNSITSAPPQPSDPAITAKAAKYDQIITLLKGVI